MASIDSLIIAILLFFASVLIFLFPSIIIHTIRPFRLYRLIFSQKTALFIAKMAGVLCLMLSITFLINYLFNFF